MGYEDTRQKTLSRVQMGLSLAWMASLAFEYEDSFLSNRLCTTLDPSNAYINQRVQSGEAITIIQATLLGFSHYDLVVDQLL